MTKALLAVSPIDGRYHSKVKQLGDYFSEFALIKYRVRVEIEYLLDLLNELGKNNFSEEQISALRNIYLNFSIEDAEAVKEIEKTTNHDVKAVEYFIKNKMEALNIDAEKEWVHFGLTSQDINNTSIPLSLKEAVNDVFLPLSKELANELKDLATQWKNIPMLARTHGQPASPTKLGKEIMVFVERLEKQIETLTTVPFSAKFGGATGNFNAHKIAFPTKNWKDFGNHFVNETLGLSRSQITTQIEHYDFIAALFDNLKRINTILLDLNRDMWTYISMDYFKQKIKKGEVGSSAMPHKVNPIDFENSEGNIGIANALYNHLSEKLPVSRLQRDLTDSTVLRNIGVPMAHSVLAIKSTQKGLSKLLLNESKLAQDLENNWAVVAEAIQTILRREQYPNPYETLKDLTRTNTQVNAETIAQFVDGLNVSDSVKAEMKAITPANYTGEELF